MSMLAAPRRSRARAVGTLFVVAALVGLPAAVATAAQPDELRQFATVAVAAIAEERALVTLAAELADQPAPHRAVRAELTRADDAGAAVLDQLPSTFSSDVRIALAAIPRAADGMVTVAEAPADSVYATAVDELLAAAWTARAAPAAPDAAAGSGLAMLIVVALMFIALGLTALLFSLRGARPRRELSVLAWSDSLTGLANRRRLDHDLRDLTTSTDAGTRRRHPVAGPTAVIMIDIDHFKQINDTHGHRFGDDVLREVSAMLTREVRRDDVVYRYGGEEFCIVLPGASDRDAARVADRIVAAARALDLPRDVKITLSAGVADGNGTAIERTLHAADKALLAAKRAGRDRTAGAQQLATSGT